MLRAVIFDVDGTLVDSNDQHARSWCEALAAHAFNIPFDKVRPLIGMGGDKVLPLVTGIDDESPEGKAIKDLRKQIFREKYLPTIRPFPETRELVLRIREDGLEVAVASSAEKSNLEPLLKIARVDDLFPLRISSSDADRSKPDPDIVAAALEKLQLEPSEAMMIGDTSYDVEAALKVGVRPIAFRCGGSTDRDLEKAIAIYDGPEDLLLNYDRSPIRALRG